MRFNFDFSSTSPPPTKTETTTEKEEEEEEEEEEEHRALTPSSTTTPPSSSSSKEEVVEWVLLHNHPLFTPSIISNSSSSSSSSSIVVSHPSSASRTLTNLFAWDGASRLYFWDSDKQCLHRISIRLGDPDPTSVVATSSSKMLQPDVQMQFVVNNICINGNGSAILLSGSDGLCVMYLYGRTSTKDSTIICRTVSVGAEIYFDNHNSIRTLQALWHPHSDTHLGILSSDSVFRLFDLSSDVEKPEQEYYLQPVEPGRCRYAAAICPVGFSFGGGHLWDRFTVFVLFSDGSIYILCPVVPFGSVYRWDSIWEIYNDAHIFGLRSSNPRAVSNSSLAIAWLEATFPELVNQAAEGGNLSALKAHPYVPFDASLSLQGPLRKVGHAEEDDSEIQGPKCEGRAVGFLYNIISKDSVLVTAWSSGQLQIDALADEIQPVWTVGNRPSLHVDSHDRILGLAMICESNMEGLSVVTLDQPLEHTVWLGNPPPLLSLAVVDLALPKNMDNGSLISMFPDPLVSERIYCLHSDGIDSIVLHFLPFTSQTSGKDETMKAPSVYPVLSTCQGETSSPSPLCGFVALADSFGYSWIVGVTSNYECIVLEMKGWNIMLPMHVDQEKKTMDSEEQEIPTPDIISKELLSGPKVVLIPHASPSLRSVAADSIEGRSTLHQYFKLFHENYVEYAHKVWFELKHHSSYLKRIIDEDDARLHEVTQKLSKVEEKQPSFEDRISRAVQRHELLEEHLRTLRNLPGAHKKPLSKAERGFKAELDRSTGRELDALRSSIEALNSRMRKFTQSSQGSGKKSPRPIQGRRRNHVPESQISNLRSAISKLSLVNSENTKKVKSVESTLKILENSKGKTLV